MKEVKAFFDKFSDNYDKLAFNQSKGLNYLSKIETDFIKKNLPNGKNKKALDIGIGTGRNSRILLNKGYLVKGIDISGKMIKAAKKKLKNKKISFFIVDANKKLPFQDSSFNAIICMRVLKYIPNWQLTIKEILRILKPGGFFIFDIANSYSIAYFGLKNANYFLFKYKEVETTLKNAGFDIISIKAGARLPFPLYANVNNKVILKFLNILEDIMNSIFPVTLLSRNVLVCCEKSKEI